MPSRHTTNPELIEILRTSIKTCSAIGVFLVPVGAVENWSPDLKAEEVVKTAGIRQAEDLMAFIAEVADFHYSAACSSSRA